MPLNLTKHVLLKSLKRLGDLLKENGKKIELVVAGGVISLLVFNSRQLTHDVDAIFNSMFKFFIQAAAGIISPIEPMFARRFNEGVGS